jgi:hypothetical protein
MRKSMAAEGLAHAAAFPELRIVRTLRLTFQPGEENPEIGHDSWTLDSIIDAYKQDHRLTLQEAL